MLVELELVGPVYGRAHLLRPPTWIAEERWELHAEVWLDDPEVGTTFAVVSGIEPFEIQSGEGCAVTATVEHDAPSTVQIEFEDGSRVEATPVHPFLVPAANAFVPAGRLRVGTVVGLLRGGGLRVDAVTESPQTRWVFNLEVEASESYGVGPDGVWVHNQCPARRSTGVAPRETPDQRALRDLIDEETLEGRLVRHPSGSGNVALSPLTVDEANTVMDWADEVGVPNHARPNDVIGNHPGRQWDGVPHVHIDGAGGSGHVPVEPGVAPR
jgi:hypothetical protein